MPRRLAPVTRNLRLNMTNKHVGQPAAVARLPRLPDRREGIQDLDVRGHHPQGRDRVPEAHQLPVTGHVEGETSELLNAQIATANPAAVTEGLPQRLRGSVRDELWRGTDRGQGSGLGEARPGHRGAARPSARRRPSGFYDIPYTPPLDPNTKQPKTPYHLAGQGRRRDRHRAGQQGAVQPDAASPGSTSSRATSRTAATPSSSSA